MPVKVNINEAQLKAKFEAAQKRVSMAVAEQVLGDCRPFVPKRGNTLNDTGNVRQAGNYAEVYWDTIYAAYQYYGCWRDGSHQIHNHTTPGTCILWCEAARKQYGKSWAQVAQNALKGG